MFQRTVFVVDSSSFELILLPSAPLLQKTVFVVDSFSVELILLPSAPLFQKTVFVADSLFSVPIFPLSAPLFQKPFVFHGMHAFCRFNLAQCFLGVSVSLCHLSASMRLFKLNSHHLNQYYHDLGVIIMFSSSILYMMYVSVRTTGMKVGLSGLCPCQSLHPLSSWVWSIPRHNH